ncbi:MAG: hypothetical protein KJO29_01835 [Bacteroidia bacterium]|nr:hypothetical protein [Bacteroidia bacterium]
MNKFDKNIREKLIDAEMSVSDGLWEAIEARIIPRRDHSRYWFFFLLPFLFLPAFLVYQFENSHTLNESRLLETLDVISSGDAFPVASIDNERMSFGFSLSPIHFSKSTDIQSTNVLFHTESEADLNSSVLNTESAINAERDNHRNMLQHTPVLSDHVKSSEYGWNTLNSGGEFRDLKSPSLFGLNTGSECPSFNIYHPGFYLYAQYSSDIPFQSLNAKNAEFIEYLQKRRTTESSAYSFSATLGVGYMFDNGIIAESGLAVDRINIKFHHRDENAIKNSTVITIDTMILNDIDTIIQTDTMIVQQTGLNEVTTYNSFTQIDIPLVLGYEFPISERLRLSLKGGVLINITSSNKGHMLGLNDFPIAYGSGSNNDNSYFKTNIGFSYTGGLNLEADLNESFSFYAGANFRYYPNSFSLPSNQINEEYTKLGIMTGIKYRL